MGNQGAFDFMGEALPFASDFFHTEKVNPSELYTAMKNAVRALDIVDKMRKAIFYENREYATGRMEIPGVTDTRDYPDLPPHLIHAILGSATEGGEKLDLLIRAMDGEEFDQVNYIEEVGDGWWYDVLGLHEVGASVEGTMHTNIKKLDARTKGKGTFDKDSFNERNLLTERKVLEGSVTKSETPGKVKVQKEPGT